jgi:hypothetical protein
VEKRALELLFERWFRDYDGAFKAGGSFRAYPPPEDSTYTGIQMDCHPRFNTCPDGDRGRQILRERSPAKRTQSHLVGSG